MAETADASARSDVVADQPEDLGRVTHGSGHGDLDDLHSLGLGQVFPADRTSGVLVAGCENLVSGPETLAQTLSDRIHARGGVLGQGNLVEAGTEEFRSLGANLFHPAPQGSENVRGRVAFDLVHPGRNGVDHFARRGAQRAGVEVHQAGVEGELHTNPGPEGGFVMGGLQIVPEAPQALVRERDRNGHTRVNRQSGTQGSEKRTSLHSRPLPTCYASVLIAPTAICARHSSKQTRLKASDGDRFEPGGTWRVEPGVALRPARVPQYWSALITSPLARVERAWYNPHGILAV